MRVAIVGSRSLRIDHISDYLPAETTEIVTGGAKGVDVSGREYAHEHGIPYREFLPDYGRYGKAAPLKRNLEIIAYADCVLAFWDGKSKGTQFVIEHCRKLGRSLRVILLIQ